MTEDETTWWRQDLRMIAVAPIRRVTPVLLPALVVLVVSRQGGSQIVSLVTVGVMFVALVAAGVVDWATTRYRVTAERVEVRSGVVFRKHLSVPRDRIRTVDVTAGPVLRVVGLASVSVGTGRHAGRSGSSELTLDGVRVGDVEALRRSLLDRTAAIRTAAIRTDPLAVDNRPSQGGTPVIGQTPDREPGLTALVPAQTRMAEPEVTIARLDWAWLRYAPLTLSGLLALGAVVGGGFNLLQNLGVEIADSGTVENAVDGVGSVPLWFLFTALAVAVVLATVVSAVLLYVEAWWQYRLAREPGGTFLLRRGLLTTRSVSIEEKRLRAVEVVEPMILRWGRGARASAVASGLDASGGFGGFGNSGSVLPPAPRAEAHRLARVMLAEQNLPDPPVALNRHPGAALRRRLVRRLAPVAVVVGTLAAIEPTRGRAWLVAVVLVPPAVGLAVDAYRNLGHRLAGTCLVTRDGALVRRTVALRRSGVIGWTISQSWLQRRAGLATVTATIAAGSGGYPVIDVGIGQGLEFAAEAVPGLLEPFLVLT